MRSGSLYDMASTPWPERTLLARTLYPRDAGVLRKWTNGDWQALVGVVLSLCRAAYCKVARYTGSVEILDSIFRTRTPRLLVHPPPPSLLVSQDPSVGTAPDVPTAAPHC